MCMIWSALAVSRKSYCLENLDKEYYRLQFLVDTGSEHLKREMEVSIAAGEIVGLLYDAFAKQYADPESEQAMKSLNMLCVRLVFLPVCRGRRYIWPPRDVS